MENNTTVEPQQKAPEIKKPGINWQIFINTVFFVLGFAVIFSLVGVLLQTVLAKSSYEVQLWLGRIGGAIVILFGLFLLNLFTPKFLTREHTFKVKKRYGSTYATSFIFGAAFAVGWTPCVSAALGAILALAATSPSTAFFLLFAYTFGIGVPFLIVGLFTSQAQGFIIRIGPALKYIQYAFGALLVVLGIFIFAGQLDQVANIPILVNFLSDLHLTTTAGGGIHSLSLVNLFIAFLAGLGSFLSPCVLPIVPGFLSYLAQTTVKEAVKSN
jgi:cytochrome c-type biogenesis protein